MKLTTQARDLTRSGNLPEAKFKIAANAKAFDILSSKLYTNTKLAIVRELSTNAYDAQVDAGNADKPFNVHLPNSFAAFFSIRDFGTGLSPEAVETIYTTYFASTRNDSDDFVGALGLGSKSPFSYTDQFTVISYFDGIMYSYSAFKNEQGEPSIALLSHTETTEPNGVEIKINVDAYDMEAFKEAAISVYRFFPVKPNITGNRITFAEYVPMYDGPGYHLYDSAKYSGFPGHINVVMGNICYAVNNNRISNNFGFAARVVLFVKIGECDFAASREELHYNDRTVDRINQALAEAEKDVSDKINTAIGITTSRLDKLKSIRKFSNILTHDLKGSTIHTEIAGKYTLKRTEIRGDKLFIGRDRWQTELNPYGDTQYLFVESDTLELKQSDKNRLRHWIRSQNSQAIPYIAIIQDRKEFVDTFGEPTAKVSDLPDAPRRSGGGYTGSRSFIKKFRGNYSRAVDSWETIVSDDVDINDAIAVQRKGSYVIINGKECSAWQADDFAKEMGYKIVYGISHTYYDRIRKELGLPDFDEECREHVENVISKLTEFQRARYYFGFDSHIYSPAFLKKIAGLSDVCDNLIAFGTAKEANSDIRSMASTFEVAVKEGPNFQDEFRKRYPLLSQVNLCYANLTDVVEYISLKEKI